MGCERQENGGKEFHVLPVIFRRPHLFQWETSEIMRSAHSAIDSPLTKNNLTLFGLVSVFILFFHPDVLTRSVAPAT